MPGTVQAFHAPSTATIAAAGTKTGAFGFGSFCSGIFVLPTGFQGTSVTFEVSTDGETFAPFHNDSGVLTLVVAAEKAYAFPIVLFGALWIKIVSGSTENAERIIQLGLKY